MDKIFCKCGHAESEHTIIDGEEEGGYINACGDYDDEIDDACRCLNFEARLTEAAQGDNNRQD